MNIKNTLAILTIATLTASVSFAEMSKECRGQFNEFASCMKAKCPKITFPADPDSLKPGTEKEVYGKAVSGCSACTSAYNQTMKVCDNEKKGSDNGANKPNDKAPGAPAGSSKPNDGGANKPADNSVSVKCPPKAGVKTYGDDGWTGVDHANAYSLVSNRVDGNWIGCTYAGPQGFNFDLSLSNNKFKSCVVKSKGEFTCQK